MRTIKVFCFEIRASLSVRRVKRIELSIPDDADDTHISRTIVDGKEHHCVKYYLDNVTPTFLELPRCKEAVEISITPLWDRQRQKDEDLQYPPYNTNRKIVIDLYL